MLEGHADDVSDVDGIDDVYRSRYRLSSKMQSEQVSIVFENLTDNLTENHPDAPVRECCGKETEKPNDGKPLTPMTTISKKSDSLSSTDNSNSYAKNKTIAEGLTDIALLSANANQLRFLITYNQKSPTYYFSLSLVILSLVLQIIVGITLIFKRRLKRCNAQLGCAHANELLLVGVFLITIVNVLLAAFTTTKVAKDQHG